MSSISPHLALNQIMDPNHIVPASSRRLNIRLSLIIMDKRSKRLISEIEKSLISKPTKIPVKSIEKLLGKKQGSDRLHELLVGTKFALENNQTQTALLLSAISLTTFPENKDCWATFGYIIQIIVATPAVWAVLEKYVGKTQDPNLLIEFRHPIRLAGKQDLVKLLPTEAVELNPILLTLQVNVAQRESMELATKILEKGKIMLDTNTFSATTEGEFLYCYGEHLLSLGRHTDVIPLLKPFIADQQKIDQIPEDQQRPLRAVLSSAQSRLGDHLGALATSLTHSISKLPIEESNAAFVYNIALIFSNLQLRETAADLYYLAFQMDKNDAATGFHALYQRSHLCNWEDRENLKSACSSAIARSFKQGTSSLRGARMLASCAFSATTMFDSLKLQSYLLERSVEAHSELPAQNHPPLTPRKTGKLKIAYLSADIHSHATAFLIAGLMESHDREKFDIYLFSYGTNQADNSFRKRIRKAVGDNFLEVSQWNDEQICASIREEKIDITIDLKGFTQNGRPFLLHSRPAPLQINYLGYPASMGMPYIDYFVGDTYTLTDNNRKQFSERLITLPIFYQPPDSSRTLAESSDRSSHLDVAEDSIVLGAFNSIYKLTPEIYDIWLKLLSKHPKCILWLTETSASGKSRLLKLASMAGIEPSRIIFAPFLDQEHHIGRLAHVDIFLDTYPCVGHTTATDALFQGIPIVTIAGETFASRVAASALHHIACSELIAESYDSYYQLLDELINDKKKLEMIRCKVKDNVKKHQLFDTQRYTRVWEEALTGVFNRWKEGLSASDFFLKI